MKIIEQEVRFEEEIDGYAIIRKIERAARTCYKSEGKTSDFDHACSLVRSLVVSGHHSVLEHCNISARVITNRGVSHEWVRHRIGCSYSQESTRYCCYSNEKFGSEITVIWPWFLGRYDPSPNSFTANKQTWWLAMENAEHAYLNLLAGGCKPEEARGVLPNDLKTEFVTTMNLRAWRHFFKLRCQKAAHPQIRDLALKALSMLNGTIPVVFEDLAKEFIA